LIVGVPLYLIIFIVVYLIKKGVLLITRRINQMNDPTNEVDCPCKNGNEVNEDCEYCDGSGVIDQGSRDTAQEDYNADMSY